MAAKEKAADQKSFLAIEDKMKALKAKMAGDAEKRKNAGSLIMKLAEDQTALQAKATTRAKAAAEDGEK
jgi:hypothetical protein